MSQFTARSNTRNSPVSPELEDRLRRAAEVRAEGGSWEKAGKKLNMTAEETEELCRAHPRLYHRLWNRAGLLGLHASGNFSATLAARILEPVVRELRHAAGLKRTVRRPVSGAELELVQMLHGAIAFPHTRAHVYGMRVDGALPDLVGMMVRVWLPGAIDEVRRLHRG